MAAPRFFGRYEHSLDAKGRVVLPARMRSSFETRAYLSQHLDGCLAIWTLEEFERQMDEQLARSAAGRDARNDVRVWSSGSTEVEIDRQGRLAVPSYLKSFAQLDSNVLVIGAIDRIELWNPELWERKVAPAEQRLADPADPAPPEA